MRFISLFSGVDAASLAWVPLGWEPVCFSEIDPYACAVLAHRYPDVENVGDIANVDWSRYRGTADVTIGGFPCFPAGTLVLTDKRLTPIEDVRVGDMVLTHKGRYKKVLRTGSRIADTVRLKGQGVHEIECTPNHPFYACSKVRDWDDDGRACDESLSEPSWVNASDMAGKMWLNVSAANSAQEIPRLRVREEQGDYDLDEAFFYFVGRWLGSGWMKTEKRKGRDELYSHGIHVFCNPASANEIEARLRENEIRFDRIVSNEFRCSLAPLIDWMASNFCDDGYHKHIPSWAFSMPTEFREAMLLGYLDSVGTTTANGSKASSVSKELTVGMKMLAAGLGYASSVINAVDKADIFRTYRQPYYMRSKSAVVTQDGFWGVVRKVLPGRTSVTVYNLEVEDDNSYTADGIAVHNCQAYSMAGLRAGLADPRGGLMLEFLHACREIDSEWIVAENVPGLLSSNGGRDFETFLNAVAILWPRGGVLLADIGQPMVRRGPKA